MLRKSVGLACQVDAQPIAYFFANSGTTNAVDLDITPNSRAGHEIFPVGLAAVNTPPVQGTIATEGQLFQSCSVVSAGALTRALRSNESGAPYPTAGRGSEVQA